MSGERKRRIVPELAWDQEPPPAASRTTAAGAPPGGAVSVAVAATSTPANGGGPAVAERTSPAAGTDEAAVSIPAGAVEPARVAGDVLETTTVRVRVRSLDWLDEQVKTLRRRSRSGLTRSQLLAAYLTALEELGVSVPSPDGQTDLVSAIKSRLSQSHAK